LFGQGKKKEIIGQEGGPHIGEKKGGIVPLDEGKGRVGFEVKENFFKQGLIIGKGKKVLGGRGGE